MITDGIAPVFDLNGGRNENNMMGGGSWIWIILLFFLFGFGGNRLGGHAGDSAVNQINSDFLYTQQKIDALGQSTLSQTTAINQTLCNGFGDIRLGIAELGFRNQQCLNVA